VRSLIELSSVLDDDTEVFENHLEPNSGLFVVDDTEMQCEVVTTTRRLEEKDIAVPKADLHAEVSHGRGAQCTGAGWGNRWIEAREANRERQIFGLLEPQAGTVDS
jgi:hypothetical protein